MHLLVIVCIAWLGLPANKTGDLSGNKINSYLIIKKPVVENTPTQPNTLKPQIEQIPKAKDEPQQTSQIKNKQEDSEQSVNQLIEATSNESATNHNQLEALSEQAKSTQMLSDKGTVSATMKYIQDMNQLKNNSLANEAAREFSQTKAINANNDVLSRNQELKKLSETFALPNTNIIVDSESGDDQTLILHNEKCYNIRQTDLNDKIWRGRAVWTNSSGCSDYDKFDGQLKKSLKKYLK